MNLFNKNSQKLRHGSVSIGLVALVIVGVLLINIGATVLFSGNHLFLDMSPESYYTLSSKGDQTKRTTTMYTLMPETKQLLEASFDEINRARAEKGEDPVQVDLIFCADPDMLVQNNQLRYVYYTALALQKHFPDTIKVETNNVWTNPSAVDQYRENSYSEIYQSNIIISSGTEFRVTNARRFFVFSEYGEETPWAYHGEKIFVSNILAVTQAEAPICCLTTNHGEIDTFANPEYSQFRALLEGAGYEVRNLNLATETIPENCRLIITLSPTADFTANYKDSTVNSEIKKLQDYLAKSYSYMIFADASTPRLPVLEEYLERWGIAFERYEGDGIYQISDPSSSLDSASTAIKLIGQYEVDAPSAVWTEDMRKFGSMPKVIFDNAIGIRYAKGFRSTPYINDEDKSVSYWYGINDGDGYRRNIYDLFLTSEDATVYAVKDGKRLLDKDGNPIVSSTASPLRLMTISNQETRIAEGSGYTAVTEAAYVCAVGSVKMVSNESLNSGTYGNADALAAILRAMGQEVEPVDLNFKTMHQEVFNETLVAELAAASTATVWTIVLIALPVIAFTAAGIYVLVRRKTRH